MLLFFISLLYFQLNANNEESGVPSLMVDSYGARAMALADTFVGIGNDINTIFVNPAGLDTLNNTEISIMYLHYPLNINFGSLSFGCSLPEKVYNGFVGSSIIFFYLPEFEMYDSLGNKTDKKLSANDFVLTVGYANNPLKKLLGINQNLSVGINLKYIQTRLVDNNRSGFGMDIGLLYKTDFINFGKKGLQNNIGIGISFQNIGTSIKYEKEETMLPKNFRIGIGYNWYKDRNNDILTAVEINFPNDSDIIVSSGIEYIFQEIISIRIGYKFLGRDTDNISCGIGGKYMVFNKKLKFDYALIPMGELGIRHSFSVSMEYGEIKKSKEGDFYIERSDNEILIDVDAETRELFNYTQYTITPIGYKILNKIVKIIKNNKYKRIIIMIYTEEMGENRDINIPEKLGKKVYTYFIDRGVEESRIGYKIYRKVKEEKGKGVKIIGFKILIIKWKPEEEEKFKYHYFMGLDAYIREGYGYAIKEWEKALEIDPENEEIKRKIKEAKEKLKEKIDQK